MHLLCFFLCFWLCVVEDSHCTAVSVTLRMLLRFDPLKSEVTFLIHHYRHRFIRRYESRSRLRDECWRVRCTVEIGFWPLSCRASSWRQRQGRILSGPCSKEINHGEKNPRGKIILVEIKTSFSPHFHLFLSFFILSCPCISFGSNKAGMCFPPLPTIPWKMEVNEFGAHACLS